MATIVKTHLYQEDLHGNNPDNFIRNELHTLSVPDIDDYYFIIPRAAPFFVFSVKVFQYPSEIELIPEVDYTIGHRFIEAMDSIGRPIAGSIRFMRRDIVGHIRLEYRTLGGVWGYDDRAILRELNLKQYNPVVRTWGKIDPLPYSFPELIHDQSLDTLVGSEDLDASLERIGDILASTTAGIDESHLANFNNPHRVTAEQVQLGSVSNYATATIEETVIGDSERLFTTPRGVYEAILQQAIIPLTQVIQDSAGQIVVTKKMVGLGLVENYPPATPEQAVDITNNSVLLTPYTANLLLQRNTTDPRLDSLLLEFAGHLQADNPHGITPSMIGAMTEIEVRELIELSAQNETFDGKTGDEWLNLFPRDSDFLYFLNVMKENASESKDYLEAVNVAEFTDSRPSETDYVLRTSYNGYWVTDKLGFSKGFRDGLVMGAGNSSKAMAFFPEGSYSVDAEYNSIIPEGNAVIHATLTGTPSKIWAGNGVVCYQIASTNELIYFDETANSTIIFDAGNTNVFENVVIRSNVNWDTDGPAGIVTYSDANGIKHVKAFGGTSWVSSFDALNLNGINETITFALTDSHLMYCITSGSDNQAKLFSINPSDYSLTEVSGYKVTPINSSPVDIDAFLTSETNVTVNGVYGRIVLKSSGSYALLDLNDLTAVNVEFNLPIRSDVRYLDIMAGYGFLVSKDQKNNIDFWGDDPDNKLRNQNIRGF